MILDFLKKGGAWLGAVRSWIQWKKRNGSIVIWSSDYVLEPPMTVKEVEEAAAEAVAAFANDLIKKGKLKNEDLF